MRNPKACRSTHHQIAAFKSNLIQQSGGGSSNGRDEGYMTTHWTTVHHRGPSRAITNRLEHPIKDKDTFLKRPCHERRHHYCFCKAQKSGTHEVPLSLCQGEHLSESQLSEGVLQLDALLLVQLALLVLLRPPRLVVLMLSSAPPGWGVDGAPAPVIDASSTAVLQPATHRRRIPVRHACVGCSDSDGVDKRRSWSGQPLGEATSSNPTKVQPRPRKRAVGHFSCTWWSITLR